MSNLFQSLLNSYPESPLFSQLDAAAVRRLGALSTPRHYKVGEVVVREGAPDPYLYIIRRGRVRIEKSTSGGERSHTLNVIGPGETIGEMMLVAPAPALATVVALEPVDLLRVDLDRLRREPNEQGLRAALLGNIAGILSERLRGTSVQTVDAMDAEVQQGRLRESAGRFIVYLFAIMSAFAFVVAGLDVLGSRRPGQGLLSACLILGAASPVAVLLLRSPYALAVYGLTLHRWKRVVGEAVLYTLPVLGLLTLVKGIWVLLGPVPHTRTLWQPVAALNGSASGWFIGVVAYSLLSVPQEFFARCGLQASMRLFDTQNSAKTNWRVIIVANLMFASAHTYLGLRFMLAAFVPGLFWGWLFDRQRSLLGVSISHALIGVWALFVIGLQVIVGGQ